MENCCLFTKFKMNVNVVHLIRKESEGIQFLSLMNWNETNVVYRPESIYGFCVAFPEEKLYLTRKIGKCE